MRRGHDRADARPVPRYGRKRNALREDAVGEEPIRQRHRQRAVPDDHRCDRALADAGVEAELDEPLLEESRVLPEAIDDLRFLQQDVEVPKRKNEGLEALLREVFPIESYDGNLRLEYISYDLAEPRYTTDECRALRLTYGMPFRIQVRFVRKDKDEVMEDSIYLGEIPITPALREGGDKGSPILIQDPNSEVSKIFLEIAGKLAGQLSIASERAKQTQGLKIVSS